MGGDAGDPGQSHAPAREGVVVDWADRFLDELGRSGTIRLAARRTGVGRSTVYDRIARDADFRMAVELARLALWDVLLGAIWRHAFEGDTTTEPIVVKGGIDPDGTPLVAHVGEKITIRRSDRMLVLLARLLMPKEFGPPWPGALAIDPARPSGEDVIALARALARELGGNTAEWLRRAAALAQSGPATGGGGR